MLSICFGFLDFCKTKMSTPGSKIDPWGGLCNIKIGTTTSKMDHLARSFLRFLFGGVNMSVFGRQKVVGNERFQTTKGPSTRGDRTSDVRQVPPTMRQGVRGEVSSAPSEFRLAFGLRCKVHANIARRVVPSKTSFVISYHVCLSDDQQ